VPYTKEMNLNAQFMFRVLYGPAFHIKCS